MVLNVTVQKQSSKQLLPKFSSEAFFKIGAFKNSATGRNLCWNLFLMNLQALRQGTLLKTESSTDVLI